MAPLGTPRLAIENISNRRRITVVTGLLASALLVATLVRPAATPPLSFVPVVIHERAPLTRSAEQLIDAVGGRVTRPLPLIGGFAADVPVDRLSMLGPDGPIAGLYVDAPIRMAGIGTEAWDDLEPNLAWRKSIRLPSVPLGIDGSGVTVAMIDTGVDARPRTSAIAWSPGSTSPPAGTATTPTDTGRTSRA